MSRPAEEISLGKLVRHTEGGFKLVDCSSCMIAPACGLPGILAEATAAFINVLDKYTIADLLGRRSVLRELFSLAS